MSDKIQLQRNVYNDNLDFYTLTKLLLQAHLSDRQLILLQNIITANYGKGNLAESILAGGFTKIDYLLSIFSNTANNKLADYLDTAIDLLLIKDLVLKESKLYVAQEFKSEISKIADLLSIEYDISGLHLPYGQRVVSALLVFALTNICRDTVFLISASEDRLNCFLSKSKNLAEKYALNLTSMFQIITDECVNQSIRADAGMGYEARVTQTLFPLVNNLTGHAHDSKIKSVEYDNKFSFNGKLCGVSAKRTLRERYKQNLENTELLDVDYMFVVTLGLDLNETTLNNILSKNGNYVIVSKEQFALKEYLRTNDKVIPSDKIKESFVRIIK
ncbi:MAG: hypothetical protein FWD49_05285 [Firmicutes bacterium]|nr:hypothetical protein [Bacillota bacterium]